MSINSKTALALLLGSALVAGTAHTAERGFYIGGSAGQTTVKIDDLDIDEDDTAWKGYVGYTFLPWLAIEGGYTDLGRASDNFLGTDVHLDVTAWQAFLVGIVPLGPVDLFAKAGGASLDAELDAGAFGTEHDSDEYFAYGAGLAYNFGRWAVRAEYEAYDVDDIDDLYVVSAGLTYHFGGKKAKPVPVVTPAPAPAPAPAPKPVPVAPAKCADGDGDGVCDTADQCPDTPAGARVDAAGCDCNYNMQLQFALNSAQLHPSDYAKLDVILPVLKNPKLGAVGGEVSGYTDSTGTAEYNLALSQRRAQAVADYYRSKGVNLDNRFIVKGYGEADPIASNDTKEGREQNRRVVLRRTDCGTR